MNDVWVHVDWTRAVGAGGARGGRGAQPRAVQDTFDPVAVATLRAGVRARFENSVELAQLLAEEYRRKASAELEALIQLVRESE